MAATDSATQAGEQFCDVGRGVTLCYEVLGDPTDPPVLLVMGLGMQLISWEDDFCRMFTERGYCVVRYDNRDAGRSTSMDGPPPGIVQLATRRFDERQYDLGDMADDAAGLLRELDMAPAHVVGASLGGMIAQTLAARHPESVRTLTSIMSTTGSRWRGQPAMGTYRYLLRAAPRDRDAFIDHTEAVFSFISSPGFSLDRNGMRERAGRSYDRGTNPAGTGRQMAALLTSGDRTEELGQVRAPTLVVHGAADKMVAPSGGAATAKAIRGAELMTIEGMGHDLPRGVWPQLVDAITERARRYDGG
jgi:pimeloyl-ACP methyl ester carboxylesterase